MLFIAGLMLGFAIGAICGCGMQRDITEEEMTQKFAAQCKACRKDNMGIS